MKKNMKLVLIVVLIVIGVVVALFISGVLPVDKTNMIYNKNKEIAQDYDTFGINGKVESEISENTLNLKINLKGMYTIWKYDALEDETLTVTCDTKSSEGLFKVVLITPDDEVITILEHEKDQVECLLGDISISKGENRIKLVGKDNADIDISIVIDKGEFTVREK